jgi:hypothetical protein
MRAGHSSHRTVATTGSVAVLEMSDLSAVVFDAYCLANGRSRIVAGVVRDSG